MLNVLGASEAAAGLSSPEEQYSKIAQAVAALLSHTIAAAVERAVAAGISQLRKELGDHAKKAVRHCVWQYAKTQQYILDQLDDLENRSRRNNLRTIGLPESFTPGEVCSTGILVAIWLTCPCLVERAHHPGAPSKDRRSPQPVIVQYRNYSDRVALLQSFHNFNALQVDGHNLLMFTGYSQEVSWQRKAFQPICAALFQKR